MRKLTTEEFIQNARLVHGDKYGYGEVKYTHSRENVKIHCPDHGFFWQRASNHVSSRHSCPACVGVALGTTESFIQNARLVHGDKYGYGEVKYINSRTRVKIHCPDHGFFWQRPHHHVISESGCPTCGKTSLVTTKAFIHDARRVHGDKYGYGEVKYINQRTKVKIYCPDHGFFWQRPFSHVLDRNGCPKCSGGPISKVSQRWLDSLGVELREHRVTIGDRTIVLDGFDPASNTAYEFHGDYFHGNLNVYFSGDRNKHNGKTFKRLNIETRKREELIRSAGYKLVTIWESDWNALVKARKNDLHCDTPNDNDLELLAAD